MLFWNFESSRGARNIKSGEQATQSSFIVSSEQTPFPSGNPVASRALSAFELLFGAFIVIGHNVFRIVPNEVFVLCVVGLLSVRLRDGGPQWDSRGRHHGGAFS
jgi:hypothetical protein